MTDKQKTIISLARLKEICDAAVSSIAAADGTTTDNLSDLPPLDFAVIHKDFISLLAYIYSATTKTALSLKPSSPAYSASLSPVQDLTTHVSDLSHNVRLVRQVHGVTLLKEMRSTAEKVVSAVLRLSQTLLSNLTSSKEGTDHYLANVGEVHQAIEKARGTGGLSTNNVAATHKVWSDDQESLADALKELQEMESGENDDFDDGWDELGPDPSPELSKDELERAKKVESIVKLTNLLHKTVIKRVLAGSLQTLRDQQLNPIIDALASDSPALPAAVDDLISTVYSPQDQTEMTEQLSHLSHVVGDVRSHLGALFKLEQAAGLLKETVGTGKKTVDVQKWFGTCFEEIQKLITQLLNSFQNVQ